MTQNHPEPEPARFVEVAVSIPIWKTFTYRVPSVFADQTAVGKRVLVPFQKRKITGYVVAFPAVLSDTLDRTKVKDIIDLLDEEGLFDEALLSFFQWISRYYVHPLGEVIRSGLPPGLTVETRRILQLTPEGKDRLSALPRESEAHRILQFIDQQGGEVSFDLASRRLRIKKLHARVFSLKMQHLLAEERRLKKGGTGAKTEAFVVFGGEPNGVEAPPLTPKESEILACIRSEQRVSRTLLRQRYPRASTYLSRLLKKGCVTLDFEESYRKVSGGEAFGSDVETNLTVHQRSVLSEIEGAIDQGRFSPFLLHGVTGSGKTEVYIRATQRVIERGKEALVLVPEIALTPQLISRFRRRLGPGIAVLHSHLSPGERYDQWRQILRGRLPIAIGARSAVFAPFKKLGVVIVDEEHETGFKQEDRLKYNARDLAVMRAKMSDALLILGSATPAMESFFNAETEKFRYLELPARVEARPLPNVEVVDMRLEPRKGPFCIFSEALKEALVRNREAGGQSLLFLNRRGYAHFILCRDCGWTFRCPHCSVTLTYHAVGRILQCHHCGYTTPTPSTCPRCEGYSLHPLGFGTQRVEHEILGLMPSARIARMDRDTTSRKGAYEAIIRAMERGEVDVLIGTQMIVKGHDFPKITLVGILCADTILNFPDFRAAERTFQLLTQAAGRAGRGDLPGRVIIQTYNPDHYSIQKAKDQDFLTFYRTEILCRKELRYPPLSRLANLRISGSSESITEAFARRLGTVAKEIKTKGPLYRDHVELLGPCSAPIQRVKGKYRWQLLAKSDRSERLHRFVRDLVERIQKETADVQLDVDIDPISLM